MIANESSVPNFTEKAPDAMSICAHAHARAHVYTRITFKLLKSNHWSQARDGLKKTPKVLVQMKRIFTNIFHDILKKDRISQFLVESISWK